ncbi:hypothetical protein [Streptomyces sp. NPDC006638]|uniref:hypothetical protein n=1 Tax=Streptomyces sp. NPDC006638 TaxID=3157183 RepID=UPI0033BC441F
MPNTAKMRIVADPETTKKILDVLNAYFTVTDPAAYSGGRSYLEIDTRPIPLRHPEAD